MTTDLITPHGGELKELYVSAEEVKMLKQEAAELPSWDLTSRQLCDIELLLNGAFSPLSGFLGKADCDHVLDEMRLNDGTIWPMQSHWMSPMILLKMSVLQVR